MPPETVDNVADTMKFEACSFSAEYRFSIGRESDSGRHYLSIPVSNRFVDYEEYYEITESDVERFKNDIDLARQFAEKCRSKTMDHALIIKPGADRGIAT